MRTKAPPRIYSGCTCQDSAFTNSEKLEVIEFLVTALRYTKVADILVAESEESTQLHKRRNLPSSRLN